MAGEHPRQPDHPDFTATLWELTQRCWDREAEGRPGIQEVIKALGELLAFNQPQAYPGQPNQSSVSIFSAASVAHLTELDSF